MRRCAGVLSAPAPADTPIESQQAKLSWVFKRSTFTNDPVTGARVGQYARKDAVEPLDDQRLVTSSYRRTRTVNNGRDGSMDTSYQVQAWGDGGGELGAQWQMFNDVWKEAILSGSFYNNEQAFGPWGSGRRGSGQRLEQWLERRLEQWRLEWRRLEQWRLGTAAATGMAAAWNGGDNWNGGGWNGRRKSAAIGRRAAGAWRGDWPSDRRTTAAGAGMTLQFRPPLTARRQSFGDV